MRYDILLEQRKKVEQIKKSELHHKDSFNEEIRKLKDTLDKIRNATIGFKNKEEFYVDKLAEGIATIAAGVWKELPNGTIGPCVVRLSDFKTNEYGNLVGGWIYEGQENNPLIGFRGCSRYVSDDFQNAFILELRAIKKARDWGLKNIIPMLPFCRSPEEAEAIVEIMRSEGLERGKDDLLLYCMAEIPSNVICADLFSKFFDGFSIGSNDLTMLVYGVDRDEAKLLPIAKQYKYTTNSEALRRSISHLIKTAHQFSRKVGICGQAPSDDPAFLRFLVREGIDSISLNFDTFASGRINTWRTEIIESKVKDDEKLKSYQLVNRCDELIENIRVPRGKMRNRVRKQLKDVDPNLKENSDKMDEIFKELQLISKEFVKKIDSGEYEDFETLYNNYNNKIQEFIEEIPIIQKNIREFGIY